MLPAGMLPVSALPVAATLPIAAACREIAAGWRPAAGRSPAHADRTWGRGGRPCRRCAATAAAREAASAPAATTTAARRGTAATTTSTASTAGPYGALRAPARVGSATASASAAVIAIRVCFMRDPRLTILSEWERLGEAMFPRNGAFRRSEHRDARSRHLHLPRRDRGQCLVGGDLGYGLRLTLPPGVEPISQRLVVERKHAGGEQRGVDRTGPPDRERADRDAGRHLHDRIE
jgi:hypothetical protein